MQPKHAVVLIALLALGGVVVSLRARRTAPESPPAVHGPAPAVARPRLSAPQLAFEPPLPAAAAGELPGTSAVARLMQRLRGGDEGPANLELTQVEAFLSQRGRDAESLLAAAQATGDKGFLREAMERFPTDPRVAFAAYGLSGPYDNRQPASAERRQWLEAFKQAAPDNALPHYLAARDDFKAGRAGAAVEELLAADGRLIEDYALDSIQNRQEAYRAAGWSEADALVAAVMDQPLPHLADLKQLAVNLADLAATYRQAGDPSSADTSVALALRLGEELERSGPFLINDLVASAIQLHGSR